MIAVIDNYDSFTYNLVQYLGELGAEPRVYRNDEVTVEELEALAPSHLVISPGPGTPAEDAGVSNAAISAFHGRIPILGVCLGHQCMAHVFGGSVGRAPQLMHGKVSRISHQGGALFAGIPATFPATRYHSLIVEEPLPAGLEVLARAADGEIMAMRHRDAPTYGVQFHPESILTPHGKRLLQNFLAMSVDRASRPRIEGAAPLSPAGPTITLPEAIDRALTGDHLSATEAEVLMMRIMDGEATPAQIGGYLTALRAKGETVAEIAGFARAMRQHATPVQATRRPLIDTCGTGGDRAGTFNISTTAALVVAGAGVAVAKHGNRSISSQCGSADVLNALGVRLDLSPQAVGRCIDEVGFGFLFAPSLHPAMKHAIGPRRELGVRTVFNILGPLANPAGASCQVVGVYDRALVEMIACVLRDLGAETAYVVNSADGLDELSLAGPNTVASLRDGRVTMLEIDGRNLGLAPARRDALQGGDAAGNAAITRAILAGERGPRRDIVLLNAGAALMAAGAAATLPAGIALAADSIDSGRAAGVLERLVAFSREAA
jgi:anthranilate synthase/phosphoribosyltransferase